MFISVAAVSCTGNVRTNNEDNFIVASEYVLLDRMNETSKLQKTLVDNDAAVIFAVCDGIGGGSNGEYASYKAVSSLRKAMEGIDPIRDEIKVTEMLRAISHTIEDYAREKQYHLVGTTLVMAAVLGGQLKVCNVGDSRAYILRNQKLSQLSMDHSEVQRMLNIGFITQEEAATYPRKHVITQYIGMSSTDALISPYYSDVVQLEEDDRILLCSDGITDLVGEETIALLLGKMTTPQKAADALVDAALQRGGYDNATAMVAFANNAPKE